LALQRWPCWVAAREHFTGCTHGEKPRAPEVVSAEPPGFREATSAEKSPNAAAVKSTSPADSKKAASPVDAGLPLKAGEVLEYTANVSKLNSVATLKLQVAGRGQFFGKEHLAFTGVCPHVESIAHGFRT